MDSTINDLSNSSTDGIGGLSNSIQDLLLRDALLPVTNRITAGDIEGLSQETLLRSTGLIDLNINPNVTNISTEIWGRFPAYSFDIIKGNPLFSKIMMLGMLPDGTVPTKVSYWIVWQALNIDIIKSSLGLPAFGSRMLYLSIVELSSDGKVNTQEIWQPDQTTGKPQYRLSSKNYTWQAFAQQVASAWSGDYHGSWGNEVSISPNSGQVELIYGNYILSGDGKNKFGIFVGLNSQTLSDELRSQLTNANDRLFLFFRTANGHMLAASHGKFYSLSDVDYRYIDPVKYPPNVSAYVFYTCLDSTDALIRESCQHLVDQYHNWTLIPESRQQVLLNGSQYWVAVGYSTPRLNATMVLLKERASVMGSIDASTAKALRDTDEKRGIAAIVFGVATAMAAILPLVIGLWLGNRLLQLARGMDSIAKLDFGRPSLPEARFREIYNFQESFLKMERGLQAFGKFVPSAVVTRLVAGNIHTDDNMETATVTVMFADIESFSTLSETMPPAQLAEVCTEYFEVMCKHVVQCDGTVDKFIGDCIMAMWNVPLPKPSHERSAVTAALLMQGEVLSLHNVWQQRGLPNLKFRMGLHTGFCLVGNFGCSYRVSYTCLGNNVNLASRLEALNKKFGTTICMSQSTYAGCQDDFHFRLLSKVTVPGCSEVLSAYEVLCAVSSRDEAGASEDLNSHCSLTDVSLFKRMVDDIRLEPVESPRVNGKGKSSSSVSDLLREETVESTMLCIVDSPSFAASSCDQDRETSIPYHWCWRDRQAVLKEAAEYGAAYSALVNSQYKQCRRLVAGHQHDKAWQALAAQLDQQIGSNQAWDGVFYFREK
eukprot:GGOE01010106.1.p1 GENE.GGOE01010106.1~~GGOE01010106.1.p1  ORF type:complete len:860 (-),score=203.27 GGOE01010106.1:1999-4476(-)